MPDISVIVPARDASATLPRTLESLARQEFDGAYEVIVVDDGSGDGCAEIAAAAPGPVRVISQQALGPASARNHGVRAAGAEMLAFCDADVYPTPRWLAAGLDALERAELVQGKVLPDPDATLGPFDRTIWVTHAAGLFETANLFVTRELFERVGGFERWLEPRWGKAMAEDVWFGYRARRLGARLGFCEHALAHHAVFQRGWREYVLERRRLEHFPQMAQKMPELRATFLYRRLFLNRRTARLDLALAGTALAAALGTPLPLVAALPYVRAATSQARRACPTGPASAAVLAADAAADVVGLAALLAGSARSGAVVV